MAASDYFHRTVKIQMSRNTPRGGLKAKVGIPVRIRREAAIQAGMFMAWKEQSGKIRCQPAFEASMHTSSVFSGGRAQLYCGFPGVFCRKYGIAKGTPFHWDMKDGKVQGFVEISKRFQRTIHARDKQLQKSLTRPILLLPQEFRLRLTIPAEFCHALNLKPGQFMRWDEQPNAIQCVPDAYEHLNTTTIEHRKAGLQVEIPKLLCTTHHLRGKSCTWTLQQGKLAGVIEVSV